MERDLRVDTDQLGRFSRALNESLTALAAARRALEQARADQLGTPDLDAACDRFQERWKHGADLLGARITAVHDGVALSREGYTQLNRALADAFRTVGHG
ncbi:hypothetical protein ACGFMM_25615 [Streptomyces sp. NPDC048604]|uniref:hypothetical protein n=1 Tax=Streptomyces sp. NPDC048604 TaxID=3365578 RepID=UPI00371D2350